MGQTTIVDRLFEQAKTKGDTAALFYEDGGQWKSHTWQDYADLCRRFAGALIDMGCEPGANINICGYNCVEWVVADVGSMVAGCVPSGIYQTNSADKVAYIVNHSEAKVLVLENKEQWDKFAKVRDEIESLEQVVMIRDIDQIDDDMAVGFEAFLARGDDHLEAVVERMEGLGHDDIGTMIYTSGTTGPPKGVMITHGNLVATADMANEVAGEALVEEDDCVVSYLPLSHIAEQMFTIHLSLTLGYAIYFAPSIDELKETLQVARPSLFFAVPRVWEKFKVAMESKLEEKSGVGAMVVNWARKVGLEGGYQIIDHGEPQGLMSLKYSIADKIFFSTLKGKVGLDRLKVAVSAAAPIGRDVIEFFMSAGIIIREVYGQSEDCGPTTFNRMEAGGTKLGTVGLPMPGVEVKIADDGEVLVKGPNVFKGYYKNPEATEETLIDGWLHSGDIGEFDEDGFLKITDRKKNIIITGGGKNIAPAPIEGKMKTFKPVSQAVMIGDQRKFPSMLITLDPEVAPEYAESKGWPTDLEELAKHEGMLDEVQKHLDGVNAQYAKVEQVKKFTLLPHEFTEESGELTPTQKIKRRVVTDHYADEIDAMYQ